MPKTTTLHLSSGNGPVTRTVIDAPIREALPHEIPIIDISGIFSHSFADRIAVADQIRSAALTNGFFYITNHGIPTPVTSSAHDASLSFFRQPTSKKDPSNNKHSLHHFGWKPTSTQRVNPFEGVDQRETFSWRYDPRYDPSVKDAHSIPEHISKFIQHDPDDFPWSATTEHTPQFKATVIPLFQSVLGLGRLLLRSFALSLNLEETAFDEKFTHPGVGMAINYYPSLPPSQPSTSTSTPPPVSIGSHTDFQLFTLLHQDPSSPKTALQVLSRCPNHPDHNPDDAQIFQWLYAKPIPGTFIVNFGDYMQRITNDKYPSTVHRVQNFGENGAGAKERLSIAFFFGFNQNETVEVLDSCVDSSKGESKKYEAVSCFDWTVRRIRGMHDTEGVVMGMGGEGGV